MKKITLFFLMFLFCTRYHLFAQPAPPSGQTWQLVESDDFNSFNDSLWGHGGTPWNTESHDGKCNIQTIEDSWVSDGNLVIRSRKGPITGPSGKSYPYSGSYVWTKVTHTYGYLEIRAQYPSSTIPGTWPAFWMLAPNLWPPEFDIAELRGEPKNYMTHAFYDGGWFGNPSYGDFSGWHTYGLEWSPGLIKYYIDGKVKSTVSRSTIPSIPMYVILSNGIDCEDADGTGLPNYYNIDYFRWYQLAADDDDDKKGTSSQSLKSTTENINNSSKKVTVYPNPVKGGNFTIQFQPGSDVDVQLFDVHGKLVLRQKGTGGKLEIKRSLPAGVYMLKVSNKKFAETKKIVVQ